MSQRPDPERRYTWLETRTFGDDRRWEVLDGKPYALSSPSVAHQLVSMHLTGVLLPYFSGNPCQLLAAPMDVRLSEFDMVQPDLMVVCEPGQLRGTHVEGPPRLIIEVLSDSTQRHDRVRKLNLYNRAGVGEYWLITPHPALVEVLSHDAGGFRVAGVYTERDRLISRVFPELSLDLGPIFADLPGQVELDEVREYWVAATGP